MPSSQPRSNDISTVISILPYPLVEHKPGLVPSTFSIPYTPPGDFTLFNVERCVHTVYLDDNRPRLIVPDPSDVVANSIVNDHKSAMVCYEHGIAEPGLGWVWGEYLNNPDGKKAFAAANAEMLRDITAKQVEWYKRLLQMADDDWSMYHRHKFITGLQRTAAEVLGQTDRPWMVDHKIEEALSKCKFCFSQVHPDACLCPTCHGILDMERYKAEYLGAGLVDKVEQRTVRSANT
jgi:hypothetical protein